MEEKTIEMQTRMYLYDLNNAAREHGFGAEDVWEFSLVTETGRVKVHKDFYPAVSVKIVPEMLLKVLYSIKSRLKQSLTREEQLPDEKSLIREDINYLVAYNPKRPRH